MIKYLGSKRLLVPSIVEAVDAIAAVGGGRTVLDLFSGTSRVGHALKRAGYRVIANDHLAYAHTLARCYIEADRETHRADAEAILAALAVVPPCAGWFTESYCIRSRYFHPDNGARIEAMRNAIAAWALPPILESIALVSLLEAADRVDSTVGLQMAYLKSWAPRALKPLELRLPDLLPRAAAGQGIALCLDAREAATTPADIAYLDPPYNQHSYLGNYHVWETLVRWDEPEVYGVACKRVDCRERRSDFNSRSRSAEALATTIQRVRAPSMVVSFSNEGFVSRAEMESLLARFGRVQVVERDHARHVGARIGIYSPRGEKVGRVGHLRNREYLFVLDRTAAPV